MLNELQKLSIKDIMLVLVVSQSTAQRLLSDIKKEQSIKIVTLQHLKKYLKI